MSLVGLLDHTVTVYRPTTVSTTYGVADDFAAVTGMTGVMAAVQRADAMLRNRGAGDVETGSHRVFMPASAPVQGGDVLDVTSGPESPVKLRAMPVTRPRGHHVEFMAEVWEGVLPT